MRSIREPSGILIGQRRFPDQASHRGQIVEYISQEKEGGDAWVAVTQLAFEAPGFEGSIASFHGISGAVVEFFPGGRAHGEISGQADGPIGKVFPQVEDAAMGVVGLLVRAIREWIDYVRDVHHGIGALQTSLATNPFGALGVCSPMQFVCLDFASIFVTILIRFMRVLKGFHNRGFY